MRLPGPGAVYISQTLNFRGPVKIGDEIDVAVEVVELTEKGRRVRLACECRVGDTRRARRRRACSACRRPRNGSRPRLDRRGRAGQFRGRKKRRSGRSPKLIGKRRFDWTGPRLPLSRSSSTPRARSRGWPAGCSRSAISTACIADIRPSSHTPSVWRGKEASRPRRSPSSRIPPTISPANPSCSG